MPFPESRSVDTILNLEQYIELLLGPKGAVSAFGSDEMRRAAWCGHARELLAVVDPGSRPWAWWEYDAPEPSLPWEPELAYLERCHLLTEMERRRLDAAGIYPASQATRKP